MTARLVVDDTDALRAVGSGDEVETVDNATVSERYMELLEAVISDMFNPDLDFVPTDDRQRCRNCPYATLCGI